MKTASWVIVDNATGKAVLETFNEKLLVKVNIEKYRAIPILEYLVSLNSKET